MSPPVYKFLLAAHILASVGWLGVVLAKVVLEITALTTNQATTAEAMRVAVHVLNVPFPPLALGTIISGVLLSLGTKWGLLRYYWVVTKLVLTVGVIVTAVQLIDRFAQAEPATLMGLSLTPVLLLLGLSATHLFVLLVATVISVYKPWGKTGVGGRTVRLPQQPIVPASRRSSPPNGG